MVRTQDAFRKTKEPRGPRPCMQSVPVVCRGAAREVSMTSRVAGRKEVRAEEASCHNPTMTTVLWSLGTPLLGPLFARCTATADGPGGRAHRATGTGTSTSTGTDTDSALSSLGGSVSSGREGYIFLAREREREREEGMQGATQVVRAHTTYPRQVRYLGTLIRPHMDTELRQRRCGRLRAGPVSECEP